MVEPRSLYEGQLVCLGPIDYEKDPEIISRWTNDPFMRFFLGGIARPLSPEAVKKMLEKTEKQMEETKNLFHFNLRARTEDKRLIGLAKLHMLDFRNGTGSLNLSIGDTRDRERGYGSDALDLMLRFAFNELNLYRVSTMSTANMIPWPQMFEKAGFKEEARRREASFQNGEYWDEVHMGLLRENWEKRQQ